MKILLLLLVFPFLSGKPPATPHPECEYKADFKTSGIDVIGTLESRVTSKVQIPVENKGTCTWKKNEVYMQVLFYAGPRGFNKSGGYNIFKTRAKHQMQTDNISPGRAAKFIIQFDAVEMNGLYRIAFSLIGKNGKIICGPVPKDLVFDGK